jgi:hypothetical protein
MMDNVAQTQDEPLIWIKSLNPGLHIENRRILDKQTEPKGHKLILHIDRDSVLAIKRTGYKIFTGLSQGTVKVLKDPEVQDQKEGGVVPNTASSESVSEGKEDGTPTPLDNQRGAADAKEENPPCTKSTSADQRIASKETWSDKKEKANEQGMETDPSPSK